MGGLIVLFIYITRLASNEKFFFNFKIIYLSPLLLITLAFAIKFKIFQFPLVEEINFKIFIYLIYTSYFIKLTIIIILYLLVTLIFTVNIVKLYEAPIRSLL